MMAPMNREHVLPSERVARDLRRRVISGEWGPGEALPSVSQLAEQYGVARATIAKVIKELASEGQVVTRERWGTFLPGRGSGESQGGGTLQHPKV